MEHDLLLKDLSARLLYNVKFPLMVWNEDIDDEEEQIVTLYSIDKCNHCRASEVDGDIDIEDIKPYLFPMDSLPEEKVHEFYCRFVSSDIPFDDFVADYWPNSFHKVLTTIDDVESIMDWYNENHVDIRGLINKSLAIDATGLNIY